MDRPSLGSRTDVLNLLIARFGYKSYLEIGVGTPTRNFRRVRCHTKVSVDPDRSAGATFRMTSDEFFATEACSYDILFIDGLHTEDQVDRDIAHSLERMNPNGTIVLHDCNPPTEWHQRPVEAFKRGEEWNGTVWKSFAKLRMTRSDIIQCVVDVDFGVGIIRQGNQLVYRHIPLDYATLESHRRQLLCLIEPNAEALLKYIDPR